MQIVSKISFDLTSPGITPRIYGKQDDSNSRIVEIALYEAGVAFEIPSSATFTIRYLSPTGASGRYDTMPDGSYAFEVSGNVITAKLVDQIFAAPGRVKAALHIVDNTSGASTWDFYIDVTASNVGDTTLSSDYINEMRAIASQVSADAEAARDAAASLDPSTYLKYNDYDPTGEVKSAGGIAAFVQESNATVITEIETKYGTLTARTRGRTAIVSGTLKNMYGVSFSFSLKNMPAFMNFDDAIVPAAVYTEISQYAAAVVIFDSGGGVTMYLKKELNDSEYVDIALTYPTV